MIKLMKAWIIAVNMGYGHQRTAYPLKDFAYNGVVISANNYEGIPKKDREVWETSKNFYEFVSRFSNNPIIGRVFFDVYNFLQSISVFYPKRDLSRPDFITKKIFSLIKKNGWGEHLIEKLKSEFFSKRKNFKINLPFITTFFIPAFMAEIFNYPGSIYCIVCDADIARDWVSLNPKNSRIRYLAPCNWVVERLKLYGVKSENIFLSGYPLPKENVGIRKEILKADLSQRILNLDPKKRYQSLYKPLIEYYLGPLPKKSNHPLTLMFSIGGAGAQKEIGAKIIKSLEKKIKDEKIRIILALGIKEELNKYFLEKIKSAGLNKGVEIIFSPNLFDYFRKFNLALRTTDILWTKPSELSFYSGLGIPLIIAPSLGSQEDFNKRWLLRIGSGFLQENPDYTSEWLFDLIEGGRLAQAAMDGFLEIENLGTYKIKRIISQNET